MKALVGKFTESCCYYENEKSTFLSNLYHIFNTVKPAYYGLGNLIIIVFFLQMDKNKLSKMSSYHFIIVNITIADLCVCLYLIYRYLIKSPIGRFECLFLMNFGSWVCPAASVWLLTLLAYARYRSVVKPFQRKMTKTKCTLFVIASWAVAFCTVSYNLSQKEYSDSTGCKVKIPHKFRNIYYGLIVIFDSVITSSLMLYFHHKIKSKLQKN